MAIEVNWYNPEKTILVWKLANAWGWEDFHASHKTLNSFLDSVDYPVIVIVDTRQTVTLPTNVILNVQRALESDHKRVELYLVVGMNLLVRTFYNTLVRGILRGHVQSDRLHMTGTLDEALRYIAQRKNP